MFNMKNMSSVRLFFIFLCIASTLSFAKGIRPIQFEKRYKEENQTFKTESLKLNSMHRFNDQSFNGKIIDLKKNSYQGKKFTSKDFDSRKSDALFSNKQKDFKNLEHKKYRQDGKKSKFSQKTNKHKEAAITKNPVLIRIDQLAAKYNKSPNQSSLRDINKDIPLVIRSDKPGLPTVQAGSKK